LTGVILFDLDGTLVDADHLHYEAWRQTLEPRGVDLSAETYRNEIMGFPNELIAERLFPTLDRSEATPLIDGKEAMFRSLATGLEPATGLVGFLDWLALRGTAAGVVTNAPRLNAEQELLGIGLADRFGALVIGEELEFSKPHPMPYRVGLERLGGAADRSLAFEDSLSGLRSAKAAGLLVIGVTTGLSAERLLSEGADLAVADFADARLHAYCAARLDGVLR
jgi:HAD superfamily hydrolase (TIGR01509 family)